MEEIWLDIPTWDNGTWTTTDFDSRDGFKTFVLSVFKEPGQYKFNNDSANIFSEQAQNFKRDKVYCTAPFKSKDFLSYWDDQKKKCRN